MKYTYITTTLPYVNDKPHLGFALEIVQADVYARFHSLLEEKVIFNTGTDEHGLKIFQKAREQNLDPLTYCTQYAEFFKNLRSSLNLSWTHFIRTTDKHHILSAQEFWKRCDANGDIYKKKYRVRYCVGCELEKTDSELVNNRCPLHPNRELEIIEEENYFFRFSQYQKKLLDLYKKNPDFVQPRFRMHEITQFVERGLEDFSISRLKKKMPWGIAVPNDPDHVMYVWFDALINYISTIGWPQDEKQFSCFWPGIQVAGKDNLRQQSAMWQAMLMSAKLPPSKKIFIHGFITSEGKKMSKSIGNVVDPVELVHRFGVDPVRYYLLREIPSLDDGDFSEQRFQELYDSDLANELGNLVSRLCTLGEKLKIEIKKTQKSTSSTDPILLSLMLSIDSFSFSTALESIWKKIKKINLSLDEDKPWSLTSEKAQPVVETLLDSLHEVGIELTPFLPQTAETIKKYTKGKITKHKPLFMRLSSLS